MAPAASTLHIERTVILIRHGVRPPTHSPALPPAIAPNAWPSWEVPDGDLTPHGAQAIKLLAAYDRTRFAPAPGCPDIAIHADVDERTIKTGEAFAAGFAPGCKISVTHATGTKDPLFSPLDTANPNFDAKAAKAAMLAAAGGTIDTPVTANAALFQDMQNTLAPGATTFLNLPAKISAKLPGTLPKISGPIAEGSSAAEDFLLEYLDGKPMAQVAWGRATAAQVVKMLALHPLAYTITARPAYIAHATASVLANEIIKDLTTGPKISVLVGHDTNQAELGGLLGLHWHLAGYPADDPPPGGGIIFTLLTDDKGQKFVTATYQAQTMDEIRYLLPKPPATEPLVIAACGSPCTLAAFTAITK
jgi:4-phytase/acid phosphatase